jgi:hypothetical protein
MAVGACFLPRRAIASWACGVMAAAAFLCVPLFNGSMDWYQIGIVYPTRHWRALAWEGPSNLGMLLQDRWHWEWKNNINFADYIPFLHDPTTGPMRYLLVGLYAIAIAMCAVAVAMHIRRRDPKLLYALVAPWVLLFALMPQMLPRYLLWGTAFSSLVAAIGVEGFLLYLILTLISMINMAREQLSHAHENAGFITDYADQWFLWLRGPYPGLGWAVVLLAAIFLCVAVIPSRKVPWTWKVKRRAKAIETQAPAPDHAEIAPA